MLKLIGAMVALAFTVSGCAQSLGPLLAAVGADPAKAAEVEDKAIGTAVRPIPVYCAAPSPTRNLLRQRVNSHENMQGAQIGIHCPGDPPLTIGE